ncbi:MAG: DUF1553 domain-containing protein, partial [Planctomycetota bacterium]|nr:DUF1553 domain-containing protein [Planctomycetota bacterium]
VYLSPIGRTMKHLLIPASSVAALICIGAFLQGDDKAVKTDSRKPGPNLVQNSSFEKTTNGSPDGWKKNTWSGNPQFSIETRFGHTGKQCVKIASTEGADASWSFPLTVKPKTDYRVTAWVKTTALGAGGYGAQINLHELQFDGKTKAIKGTNGWTQLTSEFNSGNRSQILVNCLYGGWGRATGEAWWDDIEVVELIDPVLVMNYDQKQKYFEAKVKPILEKSCFNCHGGGKKIKGELILTNREDLLKGGETGPAVDLKNPKDSLLLSAINYEDYEMPPSGKLPAAQIEILTNWIKLGAPWKGPGLKPTVVDSGHKVPEVNEQTKQWWSYQPVKRPAVPQINNPWVQNPIDAFIAEKLTGAGLKPNSMASKETLIRRAYYDLTGLPPTPAAVEAFKKDNSPTAWAKLIEQLLDSKHYGEKWGRHWLDLVRYAESNSYERDGPKPFVWRYRDYVIESFNNDKPYSQFVIEQLAGDELDVVTRESIIATGYYRLGKWDDEPVDHVQAWYDDMDDVVATTGQSFLGMTINCSRCHDHKIDPIPQADYYSFLSFFRNIRRYGVRGHNTVLDASVRSIASKEEEMRQQDEIKKHKQEILENNQAMAQIEKIAKKDFIPVEFEEFKNENRRIDLVKKRVGKSISNEQFKEYQALTKRKRDLRRFKPKALESALCVKETGKDPQETFVMIRGNAHAKGQKVEPAFPSVLSPPTPEIVKTVDRNSTGRRLALAKWIVSKGNPLTARVMINRIWQHHFGRGIVRSTSDFGFQGSKPTHPELLDWLASEFMAGDWKIKRMHKLMMMSKTYQMSSASAKESLGKDPVNNFFWRANMRRLTAEEIRDSILTVNQSLNKDKMFGPSIYPKIPREILHGQSRPGEHWHTSSGAEADRRSIYISIKRSLPVPFMASFDVNDPDAPCPVRFNTVQPTQALAMINSEFLNEEAKVFADNLQQESKNVREQVSLALHRVLQRKPVGTEIDRGIQLLDRLQKEDQLSEPEALRLFCLVTLNLNEFLFLD